MRARAERFYHLNNCRDTVKDLREDCAENLRQMEEDMEDYRESYEELMEAEADLVIAHQTRGPRTESLRQYNPLCCDCDKPAERVAKDVNGNGNGTYGNRSLLLCADHYSKRLLQANANLIPLAAGEAMVKEFAIMRAAGLQEEKFV